MMKIDYDNYELDIIDETKLKKKVLCPYENKYILIKNYSLYDVRIEAYYPNINITSQYLMTARDENILKKRHIFYVDKTDIYVSAYVNFNPSLDKRNIDDKDKGKIYFFKNKKTSAKTVYNLKTKTINNIITKMFYNDEFIVDKFYIINLI